MFPGATPLKRRRLLLLALGPLAGVTRAADDPTDGDPFRSIQWPGLKREHFGADARVEFDPRVQVRGPALAENPVVVPISVAVEGLPDVQRIVVIVDRNPIRKVLEFEPLPGRALPAISFRFRLEQASPVRAAAQTRDGVWHVGGTLVDSAGGGCTVSGVTRQDGSWAQTLGQVSGRVFPELDGRGARLRVRVMHPMDTGLVGGIPAFYLKRIAVRDAGGTELLRLATFEPVSENPVFSFDLPGRPVGPLRVSGVDNNGNRIEGTV